jgi:addiction module RelE/StbE family toxin
MEEIKEIIWTQKFEQDFKKIRDGATQDKLEKQIMKIRFNPNFGKSLRYDLKGERTVRIKSYRLLYKVKGDKLVLLRFEHRKKVYEK